MKLNKKLTLVLTTVFLFSGLSAKAQFLELNGKVIDSDTKSILLVKPNQDVRFDPIIKIPLQNGKFHYKTRLQYPEAVTLRLGESLENGGGRYMDLFLENEKINLTIYPEEEFDKNIVKGGPLNAEYKKYKQTIDTKFSDRTKPLQDSLRLLSKNQDYDSDKMKVVRDELRKATSQDEKIVFYKKMENLKKANQHLSPKATLLTAKIKPIDDEYEQFKQDYIENNPSIVSYSLFLDQLIYDEDGIAIDCAQKTFKTLSKANPNHPYNDLASHLLEAIDNIKIGKKYVDFNAPDLDGKNVQLSDKIEGQIALLDLWATWCGPCIARSRTMVSVYNDYKDKGFTILGIAGEFKNTDRLVRFLDKEQWPWLNLVELDRQNNIWQKYGVDGGGGAMFLIDKNGKILTKDPTAEEVRDVLKTRLN